MRKTIFLTGGKGDIGRAIADKFRQNHYDVIAPESAELNLEHPELCEGFVSNLPLIDAFIHCAGFNKPKAFADIALTDLNKTLNINAVAFYAIANALVRQGKIKESGYILGISSIYGLISRNKRFSYSAAKHCLNGMIKTLALDLAAIGIKTNGLAPGFVDTKMTRQNNDSQTIANFERKIPLGRMALPEDIAKIAYFLCSDENAYINGQIIVADGGYSIGGFEH